LLTNRQVEVSLVRKRVASSIVAHQDDRPETGEQLVLELWASR
jgi:hypothetical protein